MLVVAAVVATIIVASQVCGDDQGSSPAPASGTATATPEPEIITEVTREREGMELSLSVEKGAYQPGEQIVAKAVLKNGRNDQIAYDSGVPNLPGFRLDVISDVGGEQPLQQSGDDPPPQGSIEAGADLDLEAAWDQQLDIVQDPIQAPPGKYAIRATFSARLPGRAEIVEVQAVVVFELEGAEPVLDPIALLTIALNQDEFKSWMQGRADIVVCAYPPRGFFYQGVISNGQVAETLDSVYSAQVSQGLPICGIGTDGDAWRLNFFSAVGASPNRFNLLLDLNDGAFIAAEEVTPIPIQAPAPTP